MEILIKKKNEKMKYLFQNILKHRNINYDNKTQFRTIFYNP